MSSTIEKATELVEREHRTTKMSGVYVTNDDTNEASIPGFPYIFQARRDKILVAVDIFKSGYECKTCKGQMTIKVRCICEETKRPGFKYELSEGDTAYTEAQLMAKCPECKGDLESKRQTITCPECKGKGALLHLADESKALPTTGVIVSRGAMVQDPDYKCGARVLFGAYSGTMIPTRAPGVVFKVLREEEILLTIKGGEDMASFDFVSIDKDL